MQLSLFDTNGDDDTGCPYSHFAASTAYRNLGCRCPRCRAWKQQGRRGLLLGQCAYEGCDAQRLKWRRCCAEHQLPPKPSKVRSEGTCETCGRDMCWYESVLDHTRDDLRDLYRRICGGCSKLYMRSIRAHHLDTEWAIRLITTVDCDLCHERFGTNDKGRRNSRVDHDHRCCPGEHSCGNCVRGILCNRCNTILDVFDHAETIGVDKVLAYLGR